ncbi:hypothetical protein EDB85DRAFT_1890827 [Lactarius pseudohatsudake]|nr:hypothetical protein EDB85DRAFT_1890827 [Lactarius pseudohatsudake]
MVAEASRACHISDTRRQADAPPLPASRAAVCAQKAVHYDMGRTGPPLPPGPSLPPNIRLLRGRRTRRSPLPCPRRPVRAERVLMRARRPGPSLPVHGGQHAHPSPLRPRRRLPSPTRPAPPAYTRGGTVRPPLRAGHASPTPRAPPCPRTQEDRRRVQPHHAHGRKERDGAPTPPRRPRQPSRPHTQGGGSARPPPPHGLRQPGVYARRHARALSGMQEGRCAQPSPLRAGCATPALPGYTRQAREEGVHGTRGDTTRARAASGVARRVCGRGGAGRNPGGGAAHERKGGHIGARVQKGESDGEGVVNEAKRSRGEAARVNSGHPPHQ